jgi:hypothetical protein
MLNEFLHWFSSDAPSHDDGPNQEQRDRMIEVGRRCIEERRQLKMICADVAIGLRYGEEVLCALPNSTLHEPHAVREYVGGSRGTSIRIMKGVSFRVGGYAGHSESHDELRQQDQGNFVITNQRVIFCGEKRTVTIEIDKIISTDTYTDGLRINKDGRDKPYVFAFDQTLRSTIDGVEFYPIGAVPQLVINMTKMLALPAPPPTPPAPPTLTVVQ